MKIDKLIEILPISFDLKKINLQILGTIIGLMACSIILLIGSLVKDSWLIILFTVVGEAVLYITVMITAGSVCRIIYQETEGIKISTPEAVKFSLRYSASLILSPLLVGISALAVVSVELVLAFLGQIPAVGSILLSLIFIPIFIVNLLVILFVFFGIAFVPSVVAVEESKTISTLQTLYQIIRKTPVQLIIYFSAASILFLLVVIWTNLLMIGSLCLTGGVLWPLREMILLQKIQEGGLNLSASLNIAYVLTGLSILILLIYMISYLIVLCETIFTTIYLSVREKIILVRQ